MKKYLTLLFIAILQSVATHAQPPLPLKSSISVKEAPSQVPAVTVGKKCKLAHNIITYTPVVLLGADAQGEPVMWRFFAGVKNSAGKGLLLVKEQTISPGETIEITPIVADALEWQCSCCRSINREWPKLLGWYAELAKDDKVIARARSMNGSSEMTKLIEEKPTVPRSEHNGGLTISTLDESQSDKQWGKAITVKENEVVRVVSPEGQALIQFTSISGRTASYRWRFKPSSSTAERTGCGEVSESSASQRTNPDGSTARIVKTTVVAGPLSLNWSMRGTGASYLYPDTQSTVKILPAQAFEVSFQEASSITTSDMATPTPAPLPRTIPSPAAEANPANAPKDQAPANSGKSWSPQEEQNLRDEVKSGKSINEIAIAHGRTRNAITAHIKKLGLSDSKTP